MRQVIRWSVLILLTSLAIGTVFAFPLSQETGPENIEQAFLRDLRVNIEILANRVFGGGVRPETWSGSEDFAADDMIGLLFLDNEQLADAVFGINAETGVGPSIASGNHTCSGN